MRWYRQKKIGSLYNIVFCNPLFSFVIYLIVFFFHKYFITGFTTLWNKQNLTSEAKCELSGKGDCFVAETLVGKLKPCSLILSCSLKYLIVAGIYSALTTSYIINGNALFHRCYLLSSLDNPIWLAVSSLCSFYM